LLLVQQRGLLYHEPNQSKRKQDERRTFTKPPFGSTRAIAIAGETGVASGTNAIDTEGSILLLPLQTVSPVPT
jgi:hypothetical protein